MEIKLNFVIDDVYIASDRELLYAIHYLWACLGEVWKRKTSQANDWLVLFSKRRCYHLQGWEWKWNSKRQYRTILVRQKYLNKALLNKWKFQEQKK